MFYSDEGGSAITLENALGITSAADLAREEERISKKKAVELFEKGILNELKARTFSSLQFIHKYLSEDIYDFAVELRTVNMAKLPCRLIICKGGIMFHGILLNRAISAGCWLASIRM